MKRIEQKYNIFGNPQANDAAAENAQQPGTRPLKHSIFGDGLFDIARKPEAGVPKKKAGNGMTKYQIFDNGSIWEKRETPNPSTQLARVAQAQRPPQVKHDIFGASSPPTHDIFGHAVKAPAAENKLVSVASHEVAIAAGVVVARSAINMFGKAMNLLLPGPKKTVPPEEAAEKIVQENTIALEELHAKFASVPLTDVGSLPEFVSFRSHLAEGVQPRHWLAEATRRRKEDIETARQIDNHNQVVMAARDKLRTMQKLGTVSTDDFLIHRSGEHKDRSGVLQAFQSGIRKKLFKSITTRRMETGQHDTIGDDQLILDFTNGGTLWALNPSKGRSAEPRPLKDIPSRYELKVIAPEFTVGPDTQLKTWNQQPINKMGLGRIQLVDREDGEVEVEVATPHAKQFVDLVFDAKSILATATQRLDNSVTPIGQLPDYIPVKRKRDNQGIFVDNRQIIVGEDGVPFDQFLTSIEDTQAIRRQNSRGSGDWNSIFSDEQKLFDTEELPF